MLTDGGIYDNLGLETAWNNYQTILVSDGGGRLSVEEEPKNDWFHSSYRVISLIDNQVRAQRKLRVVESYKSGARKGAYWGVWTRIADYKLADALPCSRDRTMELSETPTHLKRMDDRLQERLINWGYPVCDAALRKYANPSVAKPRSFPIQRRGCDISWVRGDRRLEANGHKHLLLCESAYQPMHSPERDTFKMPMLSA